MNVFRDGVIAFFSAVGMTTVVWLLAGAVLHAGRPTIPGLLLVLPVRGEALALEHDVRELRRVRSSLPGAQIVIADCGLTAEARGLADYLAEREDNAAVVDSYNSNGELSIRTRYFLNDFGLETGEREELPLA